MWYSKTEIENWDRCDEQLFNILKLITTDPAGSFLLRYQPKGLQDQTAKMHGKHWLLSREIIQRKDGAYSYLRSTTSKLLPVTTLFALYDKLVYVGDTISEERLTDIVVEGLTDDYDGIKYDGERDPDFDISDNEVTMRNTYLTRVARGILTNVGVRDRESGMIAASPLDRSVMRTKFRGKCYL